MRNIILSLLALTFSLSCFAAQYTKYTGTLTGAAGTLITALDAALVTGQGWGNTSPAAGTNKKCYRPAAGNRFYFRVDDNATGTGGAKEALIRGAESWTDIDTPSLNPFPSDAQSALTADSLVIRKSTTTDATTHAYVIYADDRTAIIFIKSGDATTAYTSVTYIGDFYSLVTSDGYRTCLFARNGENVSSVTTEPFYVSAGNFGNTTQVGYGKFCPRSYLGIGTSIWLNWLGDTKLQNTVALSGSLETPNPAGGGIYLTRLHLEEYTAAKTVYRGRLRGIYTWCHDAQPYADGDTFSGSGDLAGKTFQIINPIYAAGSVNTLVIETSNTLPTN